MSKQVIFIPGSDSSDIPFLTGPFIVLTFNTPACIANKMTLVRQRRVLIPSAARARLNTDGYVGFTRRDFHSPAGEINADRRKLKINGNGI
jgi:hypothetical protein